MRQNSRMLRVALDLLIALQRKNEEDTDKVKATKSAFSRNKFVLISWKIITLVRQRHDNITDKIFRFKIKSP
jgi:hypothetical protein